MQRGDLCTEEITEASRGWAQRDPGVSAAWTRPGWEPGHQPTVSVLAMPLAPPRHGSPVRTQATPGQARRRHSSPARLQTSHLTSPSLDGLIMENRASNVIYLSERQWGSREVTHMEALSVSIIRSGKNPSN